MAFFGVPNDADPIAVKDLIDDVLQPLEKKLMKDDPDNFPTYRHGRTDWVEYSMTKAMPFGMPQEKSAPNAEWKPNDRYPLSFKWLNKTPQD